MSGINFDDYLDSTADNTPAMSAMSGDAQLRMTLLALLPKDGTRVTVRALAAATCVSQSVVTNVLFDTWFAGQVGYDMPTDSYFCIPLGDTL